MNKETIEEILNKVQNLNPDNLENFMTRMNMEQPYLVDYLLKETENIFDDEEKDIFIYYSLLVWLVILQTQSDIRLVQIKQIVRIRESNIKFLLDFKGNQKLSLKDKLLKLSHGFNGSIILESIYDRILADTEGNPEIREENLGLMIFYFRIIIECLCEISIEKSLMDKTLNFFGIKL